MRTGNRAIADLNSLFDAVRAKSCHKAVTADHAVLHLPLATQQCRTLALQAEQMLQHARDQTVIQRAVLPCGKFAFSVIVLTAKAEQCLGIGERIATVLTAIQIKLLECGHGQHVVHNGSECVNRCAQTVQKTVIADPLGKIAIQPGGVLFIVQPKLAQGLQRFFGLGAWQVDQLVHIQQNIAVIRRQIHAVRADILTPPKVIGKLRLGHLPILRHVGEKPHVRRGLADNLSQIFAVTAEFLIVSIARSPGVHTHVMHKSPLQVVHCLRLGDGLGNGGFFYGGLTAELGLSILPWLVRACNLDLHSLGRTRFSLHSRAFCRQQPVNIPECIQLIPAVLLAHFHSPISHFL